MIEPWIIFAMITSFSFGVMWVLDRSFVGTAKRNIKPYAYATFSLTSTTIFMTALMFAVTGIPTITKSLLVYSLIIGIFSSMASATYYYALRHGEASYTAPLGKLSAIFSLGFAFLFLGETITAYTIVGTTLIVAGSYFIMEKQKGKWIHLPKLNLATTLIITTAILWAIRATFDKISVGILDPIIIATFSTYFRAIIAIGIGTTLQRKDTIQFWHHLKKTKLTIGQITLRGILGTVSTASIYLALATGEMNKVIPLVDTSSLFTVIFGALFLKEKETAKRVVGSIIIILGAAFLVA